MHSTVDTRSLVNPKFEARSTKQIQNPNFQMSKTQILKLTYLFWSFGFSEFEFVSDFDIRISNLSPFPGTAWEKKRAGSIFPPDF